MKNLLFFVISIIALISLFVLTHSLYIKKKRKDKIILQKPRRIVTIKMEVLSIAELYKYFYSEENLIIRNNSLLRPSAIKFGWHKVAFFLMYKHNRKIPVDQHIIICKYKKIEPKLKIAFKNNSILVDSSTAAEFPQNSSI